MTLRLGRAGWREPPTTGTGIHPRIKSEGMPRSKTL